MAISSKNYFHFTKQIEYIRDILENGFWPRYCKEYGWGNRYSFAIPMVCFCDIPLSQISEHTKFYGGWGIGVKPSWKKKHSDFTPVQYIALSSNEYNFVNRLITTLKNGTIDEIGIKKLLLAKKVSGKVLVNSEKYSEKKFYNEREWRYVPSSLEHNKLIIPFMTKTGFDTDEYSKSTEHMKVPIAPEDISYLIIPSEYYRPKMISVLKAIYSSKKYKDILYILVSRIVSLEQIKDDF